MSATQLVVVDDRNPSIIFSGAWVQDTGVSGIASADEEKILGPAFNGTATFSEANTSLSFTFTGTGINLNGGINFVPTGTFARCFIDGVATDNSTDLMLGSGVVGTNSNPLCDDPFLPDGTHVLTFNISGMGSYTAAPGAKGATNRVWIDEIVYTPSSSVAIDTVPAIQVFAADSQIQYSTGWKSDSNNNAQVTSQNGASVTFAFQGTSIDYYGTLLNDVQQTASSTATFSIDGQNPVPISIVDFETGTTANNVPLFRSGFLPAGKHTLKVVNQGNGTVIPLALNYLVVVPSPDSATVSVNTGTTASAATTNPAFPTTVSSTVTDTSNTGMSGASTATSPPPVTTSDPALDGPKKGLSGGAIGGIVAAVLVLLALLLLVLLLFLRRRRRKASPFTRESALQTELKYPDISAIPRPEIPTPLPLPGPQQGNNPPRGNMAAYSTQKPSLGGSPPSQPQPYGSGSDRDRKRRPGYTPASEDTTVPSTTTTTRPSPVEPSPSSKASLVDRDRNPRPLSDLIINHDDSGLRLPQPDEEVVVRRVVEFPPTYAP